MPIDWTMYTSKRYSYAVIDEATARQEDGMCFGSDYINQVAVVNEGRVYLKWLLSASPFTGTSLATFDHFVGSFRFL